jgi:HEAT repeat protein
MSTIRSMGGALSFVLVVLVAGLDVDPSARVLPGRFNDATWVQTRDAATPSLVGSPESDHRLDEQTDGSREIAAPRQRVPTDPSTVREELTLSDGQLTLHVVDRSLISILERLSILQTDVAILFKDRSIERPVTAHLERAPLDSALRGLLSEEDVLLLYRNGERGSSTLKAVLIYPKGQGEAVVADFKQVADATTQLTHALDSPDEAERGRAVQDAIDRFGTDAQDLVLRAMDDPSDHVRTVALSSAMEAAFTLPVDTLIRLATTDPVPSVRMSAMQGLASNVEGADGPQRLNAITDVASRDPDAQVRDRAAAVLQQLANEPTPPEIQEPPDR